MKKFLSVILAGTMAFALSACGGGSAPSPAASPSESAGASAGASASATASAGASTGKKVLGIIMPNADHGFLGESIKHAEAGVKEMQSKYNADYKFLTSGEASEQNNQVDTLINEKVDAIVLWPHNGDELRSAAQKVVDAKIPLIIYDRLITGFTPTAEVMGDNNKIGEMAGTYFSKFFEADLKAGQVFYLEFKGDNSTVPQQRSDGFNKTKDKNLVAAQQFSTDWQRQKAMEQMETYLTTSKKEDIEKIKAVFTHDDEVALGILDAIQNYKGEAKLNIKLISGVSGMKDYLDTFKPIKEKYDISQVTYEFSPSMVRNAVEVGLQVLSGESKSGLILIPTAEIDNSSEEAYRNSDVYKVRYSLN